MQQIVLISGVSIYTKGMKILASCLMLNLLALHPVHVSYTSIDIAAETGEISLVYKFFTDDLKLLFYHYYERELPFDPEKDLTGDEVDLISRHILGSFALKEKDDKTVNLTFVRKEQNEESIWLYFRGKFDPPVPDTLALTTTLLLDVFEDQTNLVILTMDGDEKGFRFAYRTREMKIGLKN
jgi:hypothetical protein